MIAKYLITFAVLGHACASILAFEEDPLFVPGVRLDRPSKNQFLKKSKSYCDGTVTAHCVDCKHIAICVGTDEVSFRRCDRFSPFCVENDVSADCSLDFDADVETCTPEVSKFACTDVGYFPNPHYCHIYHICDGPGGKAVAYACPSNYVYHAESRSCMKKSSMDDCVTVKCDKNIESVWAQYGDSSEYYAFCPFNTILMEGSDDIIMYKCDDGFFFDGARCSYKCMESGRFADRINNGRFFECFYENGELQYIVRDCPQGFIFNVRTTLCQLVLTNLLSEESMIMEPKPVLIG